MDHVDVGGLRVAYRRHGQGPPLVLLHGAVCDSRVWRVALETLSDDFTVIAWDAPGCGDSSDPPEHFRMPQYAECLAGFMEALGLRRAHLLGHSYGSALALQFCGLHPSAAQSLILVGGYAGWAGSLDAEEVERRLQFALRVADLPAGKFEPSSMPGLFSAALPTDRASELSTIMSEIRPAGTRPMAHALAEADLRDLLAGIDVPTLLINGDADQRSPLSVAEALHTSIPRSTLTVMPGLGHECFLEAAEDFGTVVRNFLASLDATGTSSRGT